MKYSHFTSAIGASYYVYTPHFSVLLASTPGSGGQVRVTVSDQANGHDDDEAVGV